MRQPPLCRRHHQLKHSGQWQIAVRDDGTIDLTGPHGKTMHVVYPSVHDQPSAWDPPPDPAPEPPDDAPAAVGPDDDPPPF